MLKVLSDAFEEAWGAIAGNFSLTEYDQARETLAEALMATAREESNDVGRLRDAGIRAMHSMYPSHFGSVAESGRAQRLGD